MYKDNRERRPRAPTYFKAFIGNLSYDATEEDIQDFFGKSVVSVRLTEDNGRPRGYGFVDFETRQALIDALARNDEMLLDCKLWVDLAREQQSQGDTDPSHTVPMNNRARQQTAHTKFRDLGKIKTIPKDPPFRAYLGNLSYAATEEDIEDFFGESVVSVRLMEDDGRSRGYGCVEFETRQALIDALAMDNEMFLNRKLRIDVAGESQQGEDASCTVPMYKRVRQQTSPKNVKKVPNDPPFTAFIGNISYDATEEGIQDLFGYLVVSVRLMKDGGRPQGYGFVEFETRQVLLGALARNDEMFLNRKLKIDVAGKSQQGEDTVPEYKRVRQQTAPKNFRAIVDMKNVSKDPPFTAYIGNISYDATKEGIRDFFGESVVSVRLMEDNGRPRGYGFVEFETRRALIDALATNVEMFLNRKLRIDVAKKSQHGEE